MSKEEEEYYWAVERKKAMLMWLCLFCKTVCTAAAFGEPAVSSTVAPRALHPCGYHSWLEPAACALLHFSPWQLPVCVKDEYLCSRLSHVLDWFKSTRGFLEPYRTSHFVLVCFTPGTQTELLGSPHEALCRRIREVYSNWGGESRFVHVTYLCFNTHLYVCVYM